MISACPLQHPLVSSHRAQHEVPETCTRGILSHRQAQRARLVPMAADEAARHRLPAMFSSVAAPIDAILRFVDGWNDRSKPLVWGRSAKQTLARLNRQRCHEMVH